MTEILNTHEVFANYKDSFTKLSPIEFSI